MRKKGAERASQVKKRYNIKDFHSLSGRLLRQVRKDRMDLCDRVGVRKHPT